MEVTKNTILITGGTSGIGFELAGQLSTLGNSVIITGRDRRRLEKAQRELPGVYLLQSDVSDPKAISLLFEAIIANFPELNVLINNAGIMRRINLMDAGNGLDDISREIETDLTGPIRMVKQFLPHLATRRNAAIVNVSSGLAFVPFPIAPVYCAAKAGLHSFTESMRVQLMKTGVKVFEVTPPPVRTPLLTENFDPEETMGFPAMDVATLAALTIDGLKKDRFEIRPGRSNALKLMNRLAPRFILRQLSKPVEAMMTQATPRST